MLIAIDPGTKHAGVSVWGESGALMLAYGVRTADRNAAAEILATIWRYVPTDVVIEAPREYQARPGVRADALILLALLCGELKGALVARWSARVEYVTAPEWKRGIPKPERAADPYIVERRCRRILSAAEAGCVTAPAGAGSWDVWDAVGIGLVRVKRAAPGLGAAVEVVR